MDDFRLFTTTPADPLSTAVEMLLYAQGSIPGQMETILPHGKFALGFSLGGPHRLGKHPTAELNPSFEEGWFAGLQTSPLYHHPPATTHVHGIIFDALAFSELFPQNMVTWKDSTADAFAVVGSRFGRRLIDLCRQHPDVTEAHQALCERLLSRFKQRRRHPAWLWHGYQQICRRQGRLRLERLYRRLEVSGRHFNQTFQSATGLTPKALCRVLRLNSVLAAVDPTRKINWTDLAHDADYSDQSHFNREFRHFTGMTPRQYVEARQAGYGDLQPGADVSFVPEMDRPASHPGRSGGSDLFKPE